MRFQDIADILAVPDLRERLDHVEVALNEAVAGDGALLGTASLRVANGGGKRLRPLLTIAVAELAACFDERVVAGSAAVELVQVGSLVHDDIFEEAATRRGVPTINAVEGTKHALLAGDYILAVAGGLAATVSAEAAGLLGRTVVKLCEGQIVEMQDVHNVERSITDYLRSIRGKTASLFSASCQIGAMCAGFDDDRLAAVGRFGDSFGMAFQLLDDVLDFIADPVVLGKPVGIDLETGVYTLPVLDALRAPGGQQLAGMLRRRTPEDLALARERVRAAGTLETTVAEARRHAKAATEALAPLGEDRGVTGLRALPTRYVDLALHHFTSGRWTGAAAS
ncbi:MAG: polyprenyl synthetase family protein [Acidimicrobiia bacterium]|nr:polyprenyl synthetase family protein [Acidimicrobiia bacterium]